jgi:hypothetical protein
MGLVEVIPLVVESLDLPATPVARRDGISPSPSEAFLLRISGRMEPNGSITRPAERPPRVCQVADSRKLREEEDVLGRRQHYSFSWLTK